jgi:alkyl hydroperoxide reductase subunit AhpC
MTMKSKPNPVRVSVRSVFDVDHSRLGIGVFSRPLLDDEARKFRKAWEMEAMPGLEEVQVEAKRVSFVADPDRVTQAWSSIDRALARATEDAWRKAS